jgi:hypothetical protein
VNAKVSECLYYAWLSNTANATMLSGEQGYLCLKRFLEEEWQK